MRRITFHRIGEYALVCIFFVRKRGGVSLHFREYRSHILFRCHDEHAKGYGHIGADSKTNVVGLGGNRSISRGMVLEAHQNLSAGDGEALSCADVKRHSFPTGRIDVQTHGCEGFSFGVFAYSLFLQIARVLASNHILGTKRSDRF